MGKEQKYMTEGDNKGNKTHKTLRDKLRKRREEQKKHKKLKSEKKKQYNPEEEKLNFFSKGENKEEGDRTVKIKKIMKHIDKFINIYEDDLNEFYDMFKTFDDGGGIDISGLDNKSLFKCLKKLFKYLPLKKQNGEHKKMETATVSLQIFIKQKVTQSIENYLQNGSQQGDSDDSSGEQNHKQKKQKKQKKKAVKEEEDEGPTEPMRLYKGVVAEPEDFDKMGPCIPEGERQKLAQMFDLQLQKMKKEKEAAPQGQEDEFDQIFSMYQTRGEMRAAAMPVVEQEVPDHLMAKGSAKIGQKAPINEAEMEEFNKLYRPKKLTEIHKEMMECNGPADATKKRRFKDDGKGNDNMSNSAFFDFRSKMSKPKTTNQFL